MTVARTASKRSTKTRLGPCAAITTSGACCCEGWSSPAFVAGYAQCSCGHTQQVHAALEQAGAG